MDTMDVAVVGNAIKEWWPVVTGAGAAGLYAARVVRRKYRVGKALVLSVLAKVDRMDVSLGPNGGASLADKINSSHAMGVASLQAIHALDSRVSDFSDYIERALFEADARGRMIRVNVALERMFGYPAASLAGSAWLMLVAPADRDRIAKEWGAAIEEGRLYQAHATYMTAEGALIPVLVRAHPWTDRAGLVMGWRGEIAVERGIPA